jgi:hypothetical protein
MSWQQCWYPSVSDNDNDQEHHDGYRENQVAFSDGYLAHAVHSFKVGRIVDCGLSFLIRGLTFLDFAGSVRVLMRT